MQCASVHSMKHATSHSVKYTCAHPVTEGGNVNEHSTHLSLINPPLLSVMKYYHF